MGKNRGQLGRANVRVAQPGALSLRYASMDATGLRQTLAGGFVGPSCLGGKRKLMSTAQPISRLSPKPFCFPVPGRDVFGGSGRFYSCSVFVAGYN